MNSPSRPRLSREPTSKFKEHLSIYVPPSEFPVEISRFSPESPPRPSRSVSTWTNTNTARSSSLSKKDAHSEVFSSPNARRSRFTKIFFNLRSMSSKEPQAAQAQSSNLAPWPPLHVEKRSCCHNCPCHSAQPKKRRKRDRILIILLVCIILFLLGNTIALNIRVYGGVSIQPPSGIPAQGLSVDAAQCLSQYNVNAPADPSGFPCSTCLSVLQAVPSDLAGVSTQDAQQIENAIQFCALRAIFESSSGDSQTALKNGNWGQDVRFCAWNGISCDGMGRVSSLSLTFPSVPSTLPNELGALSGLQSLSLIGNSAIPAGPLPGSFSNWTSLSTLHIESTGMSSLPDNLFLSLTKLTTMTLVKNSQMENNLPSSLAQSSLQNLIVNNQELNNPISSLSSSSTLQKSMRLIDLSGTSISGIIPSSISALSSLVELHLNSNSLATPLPDTFPRSLQVLSLSNNTGLTGTVSGSFCTLPNLTSCEVQGTGLSAPNGCGVCQFSTSPSS